MIISPRPWISSSTALDKSMFEILIIFINCAIVVFVGEVIAVDTYRALLCGSDLNES